MLAGNQNPFRLGCNPAFPTSTSAPSWPSMHSAPVHTYIHHVVGPSTAAGTCGFPQQTPAFGQQMFSCPCMSMGPACTFVHHIIGPTVAANSASGLATPAPSMTKGLYWSNTRQPWGSNSTMRGQPSTSTAPPAFGVKSSGPFGAPLGTSSAPSTSGGLFGNSDMNVDQQPSTFTAPAFGNNLAGSNAGQPEGLFDSGGTMFGQSPASTGRAFGFGEPSNRLVFRATNQQPAACGSPFGTTTTSLNQPRPQPGFPTPTTHIACPACGVFVGTTVKYEPSFWIDSTMTNGVLSLVYVARQCITCMKEYEDKSLEELRLEDYSADRKYGSKMAAGVFGTASQPASSVFSPFAPTQRPSLLFGAAENRTPFGTSATPGTFLGGASNATPTIFGNCQPGKMGRSVHHATTGNSGAFFGSGAPAGSFSGTPVTTSSDNSMASAAGVFGGPITTSSCSPMTTRPVAASIFGSPVMTSSHGPMTAGPVTANVSGTPGTSSSYTRMETSPVIFSRAFGAPVNGCAAANSAGFGTLFEAAAVTSSHSSTATSSGFPTVGLGPASGTPAGLGGPVTTPLHGPTVTSSVGFGPVFGAPAVTSSHGSTATSSAGFGPIFGSSIMTSSHRSKATNSVFGTSSHGSTATGSVGFGTLFGAPVTTPSHGSTTSSSAFSTPATTSSFLAVTSPPSFLGNPKMTSACSSSTSSDSAAIFGAPVASSCGSTGSVAARIFAASVTTSSCSPVETSPVAAAVADFPVMTSSHDSVTANAAEADNIDAPVTTTSSSPTATSSGDACISSTATDGRANARETPASSAINANSDALPIASAATTLSSSSTAAPACSSYTKNSGSSALPCTESETAPFGFQSWRWALGTIDNGSGDGAKLEPSDVAPERPSSRNTASPGTLCAICLGPLQDKSSTDSCSHAFCYTCLVEWSKVRLECPVCKERFKIIVQSDPSQE